MYRKGYMRLPTVCLCIVLVAIVCGNLANYIYGQVFSQNSRLADHILLRDFARGVIEVAIRMDSHPSDVDIIKVRRPYPGKWPIENPKQSEIEEKYSRNNEGFGDIYRSAGEWGDFGRYTMGVIHRFCETPLNLPMPRGLARKLSMILLENWKENMAKSSHIISVRG